VPQTRNGREHDHPATAGWRYQVTWLPVTDPGPVALSGTWLVVTPAGETLAEHVSGALAARGARVAVVTGEPGADALRQARDDLAGVVSLLGLDRHPEPGHPEVPRGLAHTLALVRALGEAAVNAPLWVLTRGAVGTQPPEAPDPVQAMCWGLGRVAALEHPDRWGGLIDLPAAWDERAGARLCAMLAGTGEDQVAIRPAGVFARRLNRAPRPGGGTGGWRPAGTALVTGGTGGIARHLAPWLASIGTPRVVLTSRSGPAADGMAALAARLAQTGSDAAVLTCDVTDQAQAAGLIGWITAGGRPLTTVMHAAGVQRDAAVADAELADLAAVAGAKAAGAAVLDALTRDLNLADFVLFSSVAATWGSGGQPGYAAANAYLDALAERRRAQGLPATSVAWGPWAGGGMTKAQSAGPLRRRGLELMDPALAVRALGQVLGDGGNAITIADVDWDRFVPAFSVRRASPLIGGLPEARHALAAAAVDSESDPAAGAELATRLAGLSPADQDTLLLRTVRGQAALVLGYPSPQAIGAAQAFKDMGFDSLTAVELRDRLAAVTGLRLPATLVFDYPTPDALAAELRIRALPELDQDALLGVLGQLDTLLSDTTVDDDMRELVSGRLQGFLSKWEGRDPRGARETVARKIESASDDELFEFIHKELGRS
jgi:NADP-dependent 3-hydroxy acid dehydrogenase YdfG/acyl carrier protein